LLLASRGVAGGSAIAHNARTCQVTPDSRNQSIHVVY
jgi:hypothetical protein